jgi:hypothetical protein
MADPQTPIDQIESGNEESENDGSLGSFESPPDAYPPPKRKRSSGLQDEEYVLEEEVYEHLELNVLFLTIVVLSMTLFTPFLECPSMSKCSKIISSGGNNYSNAGARTWSPKVEHRDTILEQDV